MANVFDQFDNAPVADVPAQSGNIFDQFDVADISTPPDLPQDTGGKGLRAKYRNTIPNMDDSRALEGTWQAQTALRNLLEPFQAHGQPEPETTIINAPPDNPDELANIIPNEKLRHAIAAGANIMAGFVPKSLEDVKQMLAPPTYQRFQEDIARSKPEYEAVEKTPPFSQERFEHYGNAAAQILMAGAIGKGTLRPKPEMTRADLDAKIAAAQAKYEAKPEPAPTEAIRAKLGQSETRLPVEQELYPSETQAVKQMPSKAPDPESTQAVQTKSGDIPVEQTASDSTQPKIPAADESASGAGAVAAPGEKIAAAAFKLPSGEVVETGALHGNGPGGGEPGFITTFGRFLNREEAGMLATGAKQNLHAEDFYEATDIIPSLVEHPIAEQTPDLRSDYKARNAPEPVVTSTKNAVTGAEPTASLPKGSVSDTIPTPDEQTRQVAESPASTTPGDVSGQQPTGETGPGSNMGAGPGTGEAGASERPGSGTSNRAFTETHGEDVVPSGEGVDTTQLLDNARADIRGGNVDPYSVLSRTRARGIANPEEYATLAAEHERLVNDAVAKQKAGDPGAQEAVKAADDFANAIQPHKTAASNLFRLFQGDVNYDLSTPFGMDQYMKAELGRGMKPNEAPKFERMSKNINRAQSDVGQAVVRADARVKSRYAKVRDIPIEEAVSRVKDWLKDCVVQ